MHLYINGVLDSTKSRRSGTVSGIPICVWTLLHRTLALNISFRLYILLHPAQILFEHFGTEIHRGKTS